MMRMRLFALGSACTLLGLLVFALGTVAASPVAQGASHVADAQAFVDLLVKGDYAAAEEQFDPTVQEQLPEDKLQELWETLIQQVGPFKQQLSARSERVQQYEVVTVTCAFETANIDIKVTYNSAGKIAGLFFVPAQPLPGETVSPTPTFAPPPVDRSTFSEKEVTVGSGEWALPGTLSIPNGAGPFPGIVLVQGSGPNDRDETIGPNKPFRDIAWGLASRGVVVLRYDKRTKVYAEKMAQLDSLTTKEEVVDDAAAAVALLAKTEKVDPSRVFVLGHSLGAMLAPRIALAAPQVKGLVIMAGPTRPLEDSILEQYTYIFSLDGSISPAEQRQLDQLKAQVARVKDPNLSPAVPAGQLPLGIPASYWLDLRGYNPTRAASTLKQPMLILQGESDYQVTMQDLSGWKDALQSRPDVAFTSYPRLNHLFMKVEGKSTPENTMAAGHVSDQVVLNIASWVKGQPCNTFRATGQAICGRFWEYWQSHGGVAQQGYPISPEMQEKSATDGKTYTVQYFERAVFESHPEHQAPNDVLLSLLGVFLYKQKYPTGAPGQVASNAPGSVLFPETGHRVGGKILEYWATHGGLAQQGYPISEEFQEVSALNGKTYTVQYFERAVFELHPENQPPYDVLLSQLGTFRYRDVYSAGRP